MAKTYKIARVGDQCTHGAVVITGDPTRIVNGKQVARRGDLVSCPIPGHGVNPIVSVVAGPVVTTGQPTARVGSQSACGAVIITGSDDVSIDR
jgi:uncharacterized Zn-binding protein involved in type VI secretion